MTIELAAAPDRPLVPPHPLMDVYCATYRCWMTSAACRLRQKKAAPALYRRDVNIYNEAGCHTCREGITMHTQVSEVVSVPVGGGSVTARVEDVSAAAPLSKVCTKCGKEKSLNEYGKATKGKYGKKAVCKACDKVIAHERHLAIKTNPPKAPGPEARKTCTRCKQTLPAGCFSRSATSPDGLYHYCKTCKLDIQRIYRSRLKNGVEPRTEKDINLPAESPAQRMSPFSDAIDAYFAENPDKKEKISAIARKEFRSVQGQVLYFLHHELMRWTEQYG